MSTDANDIEIDYAGVPELTPLGKRIELARMERRMSKRVLAQRAGTSRQQLWRVMTGKSELTSSLCARLADVLELDSRWLRDAPRVPTGPSSDFGSNGSRHVENGRLAEHDALQLAVAPAFCETLDEYVASPAGLERTLDTLPASEDGRRLKRALLNAIEDAAEARALKLPSSFFDLRRRIVNGER